MIEIVVRPRQTGKTTEMIRRAAEHDAYIVVPNKQQASYVFRMAQDMGLRIPFPISYGELPIRGGRAAHDGVLIDNLDLIVSQLIGAPVIGVSWNGPAE